MLGFVINIKKREFIEWRNANYHENINKCAGCYHKINSQVTCKHEAIVAAGFL